MKKLMAFIEKYLLPVAGKIGTNNYLKAVSNGFATLTPLIITGAIMSLLSGLNIAPYQQFITATGIKEVISFLPRVTTDLMALYVSFAIGYNLANNKGWKDQSVQIGFCTLFVFFLMIPRVPMAPEGGSMSNVFPMTYFGAAGVFAAIILGLVVPSIYGIFIKHKIQIKMPEGVPPMVARSFAAIIPTAVIGIAFAIIRLLFSFTPFGSMNDIIYTLLRAPLTLLSSSPFTMGFFLFLCSLLWFFGIHGGQVVLPFLAMLYQDLSLENIAAFETGLPMPHTITVSNWFVYGAMGGVIASVGLSVCLIFFTRSKRYKTIGKLGLPGSLCSISEPLVFGVPVALNPILFIPAILLPVLQYALSCLFTAIGVLPVLNGMQIPTGTPVIMSGLLTGGWRVAVFQVFLLAVQVIVYLPFVKALDKKELLDEEQRKKEAAAVEA